MRSNEEYLLLLAQMCEVHAEMLDIVMLQQEAILEALEAKQLLRVADIDRRIAELQQQPSPSELRIGIGNLREAIAELKNRLKQ